MIIFKSSFLVFLIGGFLPKNIIKSQTFTTFDLDLVERLSKYLTSEFVVFVEDNENVGVVKGVRTLSGFYTVVNSTLLENILKNNVSQLDFFQRRSVIVTKEELNLTVLLNQVSFPHYLTWIIFKDHTHFPNLYIPISSEVIFINSTQETVSINRVYNLKPGIKKTVISLWSWNLNESMPSFAVELEKINFRDVSLDMLVLTPRDDCVEVHKKKLLTKLECLHQDFIEAIGRRLNFSINAVECIEKEHPFTYPNGSESELFLRLKHKEVDFSAISHVYLPKRNRHYMEFVWPTFVLKAMMYIKQGRLAGRWNSYLKPLESSVWWGILVWIIITGIFVHVFEKVLVDGLRFDRSLVVGLVGSILEALQVFCNQATSNLSSSYSTRIIYFSEFFVVLIFFQAYCGYLISSLTVIAPHYPFKDLEGFFENQQYQVMTLQKGFQQFFFRKIIGEGRREDFMLPSHELPETLQSAVDKLCTQDYLAFPEFKEDFLNFDKLKCKILELPSPIVTLYVGIAMPKPTPLKEYLRRELLHLKSAGLVERLRSRLSFQTDFRGRNTKDDFATVSMSQIFSIFILLGMGVLISICICVVELMFERRERIRRKKRSVGFIRRSMR